MLAMRCAAQWVPCPQKEQLCLVLVRAVMGAEAPFPPC